MRGLGLRVLCLPQVEFLRSRRCVTVTWMSETDKCDAVYQMIVLRSAKDDFFVQTEVIPKPFVIQVYILLSNKQKMQLRVVSY